MKKMLTSFISGIKSAFSGQQEMRVAPKIEFSSNEWVLNLTGWAHNIGRDLNYEDICIETGVYRFLNNGIIVYCVEREGDNHLPIGCFKAQHLLTKKGGVSYWNGWHNAYFEFSESNISQLKKYALKYRTAEFPETMEQGYTILDRAPDVGSLETQTA